MTTVRLTTPRFAVVFAPSSPDDREQIAVEVQTVQADVIRYDLLRRRNGWPSIADAPMLWTTVVAHAALVRLGHPVPADFEQAMPHLLSVRTITEDGAEVTEGDELGVRPTHAEA